MAESDTDKLLIAIDKIIRDPDKKYDECMIEQFLKSISDELQRLRPEDWKLQAQTILQKLQSIVDDEAFVMMNQARIYKTYLSVFRSSLITDDSYTDILHYLDDFWSSLPSVVINHDLAAVTAVLMTIERLLESKLVYEWIVVKKFQPSISVLVGERNFEIEDIASLSEFYVETSENYHTKNRAESLLKNLIRHAIEKSLTSSHQHFNQLKAITTKLIKGRSISILHILIDLISKDPLLLTRKALLDRFDVLVPLNARFETSLEIHITNLSTLCRLYGLIGDQVSSETVLCQLERKGQLEAIIALLVESQEEDKRSLLQSYLLGPLILRCGNVDPEVDHIVNRLDSIKNHLSDKTITTCLVHLGRIIDRRPTPCNSAIVSSSIKTLLDYINNQSNVPREYKNTMLCCSNLNKFLDCDCQPHVDSLMLIVSVVMETLQSIDMHDENMKPIVLALIKLFSNTHRRLPSTGQESNGKSWVEMVVDLASNCTDSDIHDELELFLQEFHQDYCPKPEEVARAKQLEEELIQEAEYRVDIKSSLNDILEYELFSENILDCY